jgi:hypothetical protein
MKSNGRSPERERGGAWVTLREHPAYLFMRTIARFDTVRRVVAAGQKVLRPDVDAYLRSITSERSRFFDGVDPAALAKGVDRDGYAFGLTLPGDTVAELQEFARTHRCFVDRNPALGFMPQDIEQARARLGRKFLLAQYFNVRAQSAVVDQLIRDPVLLAAAAGYLHSPPVLVGVNLFWSYPAALSTNQHSYAAQLFHYDLDDFKFLKYFFYLTDVDETSGPHVIVKGSHRAKRHAALIDRFRVRRYSDEEIGAAYGHHNIVTVTGPAGTGFAEDTTCIHKGLSPVSRERLILQIQYALNDWGMQHDDKDESQLRMI